MVCLWHFSDIEAAPSNSAPGFLSDLAAKVLTSSEDAHTKTMSTFETDEHLRGSRAALRTKICPPLRTTGS